MQHSLVSLLLRYTIEAWFTKGDKFLCGDLRVHARARMRPMAYLTPLPMLTY
jgi:hypothetical protein